MTPHRPIALPGPAEPLGIADQPSPMLQWVKIADMVIDDAYQRPLNQGGWRVVRGIAENFRWSCFTPVLLAPIEGGLFAVIDGQHRAHAALMCGIEAVPAMVVPIAATEQARAFVQVNTARTAMSQYNKFKAGLAAGEAWALLADITVSNTGCRLMRFALNANKRKLGDIQCVGLIRDLVTRGHAPAITATLTAIRAIDTGAPTSMVLYTDWILNPLLKAVAEFPGLDAATLTDVLRAKRPAHVMDAAERLAKTEHRSTAALAREGFVAVIRIHLAKVAA